MIDKISKSRARSIAKKIIKRAEVDQEYRIEHENGLDTIKRIDENNREYIKKIVDTFGLISISKFGKKASLSAWLLIQHFPREEIDFMENYLKLMENSPDDVDPKNIAYLKDRILMYKDKPQIYGTQLTSTNNNEKLRFHPIENVQQVDELREKKGLESLKKYSMQMEKILERKFYYQKDINDQTRSLSLPVLTCLYGSFLKQFDLLLTSFTSSNLKHNP
jgi:hypothetical protein